MLKCPNCQSDLQKIKGKGCVFWACPSCHGRSVTIPLLRRFVARRVVNQLWLKAKSGDSLRNRQCPDCQKYMAEVSVDTGSSTEAIDVCTSCQFVWFDPNEYERMPATEKKVPVQKELSQEAKERLAMIQMKEISEKAREEDSDYCAEEWWHWIPGILGMPVEEGNSLDNKPWMTWLIATMVVVISLISFLNLSEVARQFGVIPAEIMRYGGGTLLSSFFIHGSVIHLLGNIYFFLIFGDNVEDWLGKGKFLFLLISATVVGGLLHCLGDPRSHVVCIGASGGISGIIAFYALAFPNVKVSFLFHFYLYFRWVRFPAFVMFIIWGALQLLTAGAQLEGLTNVSALAHLGGALTGIICWFFFKKREKIADSGYNKSEY